MILIELIFAQNIWAVSLQGHVHLPQHDFRLEITVTCINLLISCLVLYQCWTGPMLKEHVKLPSN